MNEVKEKDKDLLAMETSSPSHVPFNLEHFLLLMTVCVVSLKNELNELFTQAIFLISADTPQNMRSVSPHLSAAPPVHPANSSNEFHS